MSYAIGTHVNLRNELLIASARGVKTGTIVARTMRGENVAWYNISMDYDGGLIQAGDDDIELSQLVTYVVWNVNYGAFVCFVAVRPGSGLMPFMWRAMPTEHFEIIEDTDAVTPVQILEQLRVMGWIERVEDHDIRGFEFTGMRFTREVDNL